jgi:hypothetical protein
MRHAGPSAGNLFGRDQIQLTKKAKMLHSANGSEDWSQRAATKPINKSQGITKEVLRRKLDAQHHACGFTGLPLLYLARHAHLWLSGSVIKGKPPFLYATVDHTHESGPLAFEIVCGGLNDIRGQFPMYLFREATYSEAWKKMVVNLHQQFRTDPSDNGAFYRIFNGR